MRRRWASGALLFLTGCMVGPDYRPPETSMPTEFEEGKETFFCTDADLCRWWKQFEDPLLDQLIEEAAVQNFDYRIALEQIVEARAQYHIQGSYLWPEIDLNASATRSRFSQNVFTTAPAAEELASGSVTSAATTTTGNGVFGPPVQNFFQVGFDAIWELDFWGKFRRGKKAAFDQWEASKFNAQNVLLMVISEVARDYVSIRSLQHQIELAELKVVTDEEQLHLAQVLFNAGLDNEIQVEGLLATLEKDRAAIPVLETSLKQTIYALAVLLGKDPEGFAQQFTEIESIPLGLAKVPAGLPSDLLRRRPDIRSAERQLAAATEQIGIAVSNYFPRISLTGTSYGYEANKLNKWFVSGSRFWTIGPSVSWDLIDFGRTRAQVESANSVQRQALLTYEQTVISSLQDVEGALVAYFEEEKRNVYLADQVAADRRSLQLTEDLYAAGLIDESGVLTALATLIDAETSLIQSDQALTSDLIALYKALGGDWECSSTP